MSEVIKLMKEETWSVARTAVLEEIQQENGAIRFRVQIMDEGRPPFISRWFNDPVPASDFIEKVQGGNYVAENDRK